MASLTSFIAFTHSPLKAKPKADWPNALILPLLYFIFSYYFGVHPKKWLPIGIVGAVTLLISLIIWGFWIPIMLGSTQLSKDARYFNVAPINLLPWPVAVAIGLFLADRAFRRQDEALGILAGFFFVPYFAPYSLPLIFAILAIKARRLAIIIYFSMWIIYGGAILIGILQR